jgi:hypothetical protein
MEAIMRGKIINFVMLTVVSAGALVAAGCASSGPSALTGSDQAELQERARYTSDKSVYRPDWRGGVNRPAAYPK